MEKGKTNFCSMAEEERSGAEGELGGWRDRISCTARVKPSCVTESRVSLTWECVSSNAVMNEPSSSKLCIS